MSEIDNVVQVDELAAWLSKLLATLTDDRAEAERRIVGLHAVEGDVWGWNEKSRGPACVLCRWDTSDGDTDADRLGACDTVRWIAWARRFDTDGYRPEWAPKSDA